MRLAAGAVAVEYAVLDGDLGLLPVPDQNAVTIIDESRLPDREYPHARFCPDTRGILRISAIAHHATLDNDR